PGRLGNYNNHTNPRPAGFIIIGDEPASRPGNHSHGNGHRPGNRPAWNNSHNQPGTHAPMHGSHNHGGYHPTPPPPPRHDHWPRYHRPTPPPRYVCHHHGPSFGSILGMVLGTAYNASLSYLYNNGYTVAGHGNNSIYLNNVSQMNYRWPNAVLYYNNGLLNSSQYIHSSTWHDTSRYNDLYNSFCRQYGVPASVSNTGMVMSASWFGYDGRFVTIQYSPGYTGSGMACYYTTLSFGN
ncbi:MAG: hypothetical protein K2L41_07725, partial [Muribaculaceae bacterium]|nr:hypothetical protein [Muribaculaceae bacterium]